MYELVRHLYADMVSLPSYRRTGKSHFRKACPTEIASDATAYRRLCKLGGDLGLSQSLVERGLRLVEPGLLFL